MVAIYILDRLTRRPATPGKVRPRLTRIAHWGSGAATAYARGINDAPKMAALGAFFLLANPSEVVWLPYSVVAVAMFFGSLVLGHRVAEKDQGKHTTLAHGSRGGGGAATPLIMFAGSILRCPFSTHHGHKGSKARRRGQ